MDETYKIAVIGGRIASLACAVSFAERGIRVHLYSPRPIERYGPAGTPGINSHGTPQSLDIINLLDKLGVPFDRTPGRRIKFEPDEQTPGISTITAGDETGRHIHRVLCDQVRRWEKARRLVRREHREVYEFILDDAGACIGLISFDLKTMEVSAESYDAVVLAVNGPLAAFGESAGINDDFGPMLTAYKSGAKWVNPHLFTWEDGLKPFIIEDQADDENRDAPPDNTCKPFALSHTGGLHVDEKFLTGIPRLYATGGCAYHADVPSPGNELFMGISTGLSCADSIKGYFESGPAPRGKFNRELSEQYADQAKDKLHTLLKIDEDSDDNAASRMSPVKFHHLLATTMRRCAGPWRNPGTLEEADYIFAEIILSEFSKISPFSTGPYANTELPRFYRLNLLIPACETIINSAKAANDSTEAKSITAEWSNEGPSIS